ncbi:MAG: hypothetical protein VYA32_07595 [Planctomycetota bacterium]|nr:hypothetical protein [Planctomycetota bacterium]
MSRVQVYCGRRLVAVCPVTVNGEFRIEGLAGGLYWVTAPVAARAVRAWAPGTAPPQAHPRLVLGPGEKVVPADYSGAIVRGQAPLLTSYPATGWVPQQVPAYPFQPYQVPGGGVMFPGTYTSPGAVFANPLVTAAMVTGVAGIILVATDDDDDELSLTASEVLDFAASP